MLYGTRSQNGVLQYNRRFPLPASFLFPAPSRCHNVVVGTCARYGAKYVKRSEGTVLNTLLWQFN